MSKDEAMTDPERHEPAAPRLRPVVRAMIWATVPVLLLVQLLASAGVEASSFWSQVKQLDARMARVAESRAELIAEPLWKMRYDQVTGVLDEIMHGTTTAVLAAVRPGRERHSRPTRLGPRDRTRGGSRGPGYRHYRSSGSQRQCSSGL